MLNGMQAVVISQVNLFLQDTVDYLCSYKFLLCVITPLNCSFWTQVGFARCLVRQHKRPVHSNPSDVNTEAVCVSLVTTCSLSGSAMCYEQLKSGLLLSAA